MGWKPIALTRKCISKKKPLICFCLKRKKVNSLKVVNFNKFVRTLITKKVCFWLLDRFIFRVSIPYSLLTVNEVAEKTLTLIQSKLHYKSVINGTTELPWILYGHFFLTKIIKLQFGGAVWDSVWLFPIWRTTANLLHYLHFQPLKGKQIVLWDRTKKKLFHTAYSLWGSYGLDSTIDIFRSLNV